MTCALSLETAPGREAGPNGDIRLPPPPTRGRSIARRVSSSADLAALVFCDGVTASMNIATLPDSVANVYQSMATAGPLLDKGVPVVLSVAGSDWYLDCQSSCTAISKRSSHASPRKPSSNPIIIIIYLFLACSWQPGRYLEGISGLPPLKKNIKKNCRARLGPLKQLEAYSLADG